MSKNTRITFKDGIRAGIGFFIGQVAVTLFGLALVFIGYILYNL